MDEVCAWPDVWNLLQSVCDDQSRLGIRTSFVRTSGHILCYIVDFSTHRPVFLLRHSSTCMVLCFVCMGGGCCCPAQTDQGWTWPAVWNLLQSLCDDHSCLGIRTCFVQQVGTSCSVLCVSRQSLLFVVRHTNPCTLLVAVRAGLFLPHADGRDMRMDLVLHCCLFRTQASFSVEAL